VILLDCTLRDGGYYNKWDFPLWVVNDYIKAMAAIGVDVIEFGFRSLKNEGWGGAHLYTTDEYLQTFDIPSFIKIAVMINASEVINQEDINNALEKLFPLDAKTSKVKIVRIACHIHEFLKALNISEWLKNKGFEVGFNLMQISNYTNNDIKTFALAAMKYPIDVLYFADSLGALDVKQVTKIVRQFRKYWNRALGIHAHDNMGLALSNTLQALDEGVEWLDATLTGMGRGPDNTKTEILVCELAQRFDKELNVVPLMSIIKNYFKPLQQKCNWGTNVYYHLAGKHSIHPTYIQSMLGDSKYSEEDILTVINHLREEGGSKYSLNALNMARNFYNGKAQGAWKPASLLQNRDVMLLGTGQGVLEHRTALEQYIKKFKPIVIALNTQSQIDSKLIDLRIACHPTRLLADCKEHIKLPQPLITPFSMLPKNIQDVLDKKEVLDYGLCIKTDIFKFNDTYSICPSSLVIAYALAVISGGRARRILMAGFDGYPAGDSRNDEMQSLLKLYISSEGNIPLLSVTNTNHSIQSKSIYGEF
jgi:4-hydroxy 2-oxovalerate aldolase